MTKDKLLGTINTSAASRAEEKFQKTGQTTSPYEAYPERECYHVYTIYQRPDGTRYVKTSEVYRWASESNWTDKGQRDLADDEYPQFPAILEKTS